MDAKVLENVIDRLHEIYVGFEENITDKSEYIEEFNDINSLYFKIEYSSSGYSISIGGVTLYSEDIDKICTCNSGFINCTDCEGCPDVSEDDILNLCIKRLNGLKDILTYTERP